MRNTRRILRPRRTLGFSLMHMLATFPLLTVFMLVGSKMFLLNNTTLMEATAEHERLGRADMAIHRLQLDVMLATRARLSDDGSKLFLEHDSATTAWAVTSPIADQAEKRPGLSRVITTAEAGDETRRYAEVGEARFELRLTGVVLVLHGERYLCPFATPGVEVGP